MDCVQTEPMKAMDKTLSLNELGILNGTDKSSLGHSYLHRYERLFGYLRNEPINVLEIGVGGGEALRMWAEYFPRAVVVGVDTRAECRRQAGGRRIIEVGDYDDAAFLDKLGALYRPTVVIDNGSHRADHIMLIFQHLYPQLRSDGHYLVECLHYHAGNGAKHWRGDASTGPQDYFLTLARLSACPETTEPFNRSIVSMTSSVEFFYGGVSIHRKPATSPQASIIEHRRLVERANHPRMWSNFSQLLLNNGGDPQEAVAACRNAVRLDPREASFRHFLSLALEGVGDLEGAIDECCESVLMNPKSEMFRERLKKLEQKHSDVATGFRSGS
jgi:hypothetical protein